MAEIGQHKKLQLFTGRYSDLYVGDHVVVACGARYAPDQFEAEATIASAGADLVAAGGLVGRVVVTHARMATPTRLKPLARLADGEGRPINLAAYALPPLTPATPRPSVIAVLGSSMNAGKTTTAVS
ncbi:MAG: DUF1611 domain-containing protein, partial [Pseudomonadota bacterium]|nr:DUF1611 domain-containing protein [Pseudomonadota bacterium]